LVPLQNLDIFLTFWAKKGQQTHVLGLKSDFFDTSKMRKIDLAQKLRGRFFAVKNSRGVWKRKNVTTNLKAPHILGDLSTPLDNLTFHEKIRIKLVLHNAVDKEAVRPIWHVKQRWVHRFDSIFDFQHFYFQEAKIC
jgi:hypothetical protein